MLKLDVGCGSQKRPGFIGIDLLPGSDVVCDVAANPLPFEDGSADYVFSSHMIEHIPLERHIHVFRELTRVAANGALIEIWHPFAFHRDAFVIGHVAYLSEEPYVHLGHTAREIWAPTLGARWYLEEIRYHVDGAVVRDLGRNSVRLDFAVRYLHDVVKEIGAFIRVDRSNSLRAEQPIQRTICSQGRENIIAQINEAP